METTKRCIHPDCEDPIKPISEFTKDKHKADGLYSYCKACCKRKYEENKEANNKRSRDWYWENKDHVKDYHQERNVDPEFQEYQKEYTEEYNARPEVKTHQKEYNQKRNADPEFQEYQKEYSKDYRSKSKTHQKEYNQKRNADPEFQEYQKEYSKEYNSRPEVKERNKKYRKERYENDKEFRLEASTRGSITYALKIGLLDSSYKGKSKEDVEAILGCTIFFYIKYLENQFYPEMTWENYSTVWEIDHIIPIASFKGELIEKQKEAFHYTNTRPLFKTTAIAGSFGYTNIVGNRNKGAKFLEDNLVI